MACKINKDIFSGACLYKPVVSAIRAYVFNRKDITISKTANLINDIQNVGTNIGYSLDVAKNGSIDFGNELVSNDSLPDYFTHFVKFPIFENDSESLLNIDSSEDLVIIIETTTKQFFALGVDSGLFKSVDTDSGYDKDVEYRSEFELFSAYEVLKEDHITTKELLESLLENIIPPFSMRVLEFENDNITNNTGFRVNGKLEIINSVNANIVNINSIELQPVTVDVSIITVFCTDPSKPLTGIEFDCNVLYPSWGENGGILLDYVKFNSSSDTNDVISSTIDYLVYYGNQSGGIMIINSPNSYPLSANQSLLEANGWTFI